MRGGSGFLADPVRQGLEMTKGECDSFAVVLNFLNIESWVIEIIQSNTPPNLVISSGARNPFKLELSFRMNEEVTKTFLCYS